MDVEEKKVGRHSALRYWTAPTAPSLAEIWSGFTASSTAFRASFLKNNETLFAHGVYAPLSYETCCIALTALEWQMPEYKACGRDST